MKIIKKIIAPNSISIPVVLIVLFLIGTLISNTSSAQIIYTIAGNGIGSEAGDGSFATAAELDLPNGVAIDDTGNVYVSDNQGYKIRKINHKTGIISTYAGIGKGGFAGDGGPATAAKLLSPEGMAFDKNGNLYLAEIFNQRIRKIAANGIITTYVGTGSAGYTGDGGQATAATLNEPVSVSVDSAGNLYIADELNNAIRKVTPAGVITTVAGNGGAGYTGDGGPATAAEMITPTDVAFDSNWNMYISDDNNVIRKVDVNTGNISTIVGDGGEGYGGDGGPALKAEIDGPVGLALDKAGNLYIVDNDNGRIREVYAATGIINTIIGNGSTGFSGDSGLATAAAMDLPFYVRLDGGGNLYFTDGGNERVRMVTNVTGIASLNESSLSISVYPCPAHDKLNITSSSNLQKGSKVELHSILGQKILEKAVTANTRFIELDVQGLSSGVYLLSVYCTDGTVTTKKVLIEN